MCAPNYTPLMDDFLFVCTICCAMPHNSPSRTGPGPDRPCRYVTLPATRVPQPVTPRCKAQRIAACIEAYPRPAPNRAGELPAVAKLCVSIGGGSWRVLFIHTDTYTRVRDNPTNGERF